MENKEINLLQLLKILLVKSWIILITMVVFSVGAFAYTKAFVTPMYTARVTFHVNNSNTNLSGTVTEAELAAGKTLLETYAVILKSRRTLNDVIDHIDSKYSYSQLYSMISAGPVNSTDILAVTVTSADPIDAQMIADLIADTLPEKIFEITGRKPISPVDYAVLPQAPSSPNVMRNAMLGAVLGMFVSAAVIILLEMLNDKFRTPQDITDRYEAPLLATIPDLLTGGDNHYSYYYRNSSDNGGGETK